jgi:hypothetical protein
MTTTLYALGRTGVHPCAGWSIGPVPTTYDPTFAWPTVPFQWKVFHETDTTMLVELTVPTEWANQWVPNLPETFIGDNLKTLFTEIVAAALSTNTNIGSINARTLLTSLGFVTEAEIRDIASHLEDILWACSPGLSSRSFGSEEEAALAGYFR